MENISNTKTSNKKSKSLKVFNVMKTLSNLAMEEVKQTTPFKVTYIANKKAKIIHARRMSDVSTDDE